jgi:glycogen(starch) synthase
VAVIGNGATEPELDGTDLAAAEARFRPSGPLLAFAGRLVHEKGLQELVKALPLLEREFPDIGLVVAGTGPDLAEQQDRAGRYRVAGRISWPGFLAGRELAALLAVADAVVVPSLYEPFGLTAVEAQLAGTPVAVCDTGGLAELVEPGRTGVRFAPQSPAAIAEAVGELLRDRAGSAASAARAQRQARSRFSWTAVAQRTADGYQRAVAGDPPGPAASRPSRPAAAG